MASGRSARGLAPAVSVDTGHDRRHNPRVPTVTPADFAVCTIFNSAEHYAAMRASFEQAGFAGSRFLGFDNTAGNEHDPYRVVSQLVVDPPAPYIIFCHQDIRLDRGNGFDRLVEVIAEVSQRDSNWAVLGNAGSTDEFEYVLRITDPSGEHKNGTLPARVHSLDENFLVIRADAGVGCSRELSGFHLYGTDLCLNARKAGKSCWAVDFHLTHLSSGDRGAALGAARERFEQRWSRETPFLFLRTPVQEIFLSRSRLLRSLLGRPKVKSWLISHNSLIQRWQRWPPT